MPASVVVQNMEVPDQNSRGCQQGGDQALLWPAPSMLRCSQYLVECLLACQSMLSRLAIVIRQRLKSPSILEHDDSSVADTAVEGAHDGMMVLYSSHEQRTVLVDPAWTAVLGFRKPQAMHEPYPPPPRVVDKLCPLLPSALTLFGAFS